MIIYGRIYSNLAKLSVNYFYVVKYTVLGIELIYTIIFVILFKLDKKILIFAYFVMTTSLRSCVHYLPPLCTNDTCQVLSLKTGDCPTHPILHQLLDKTLFQDFLAFLQNIRQCRGYISALHA